MADAARARTHPSSRYYDDIDTGHEYDGIRELDNRLPNWWLFTLWASVVFAVVYWAWFQSFGAGPTQLEQLALEHAAVQAAEAKEAAAAAAAFAEASPGLKPPTLAEEIAELQRSEQAMARGKGTFEQSCAACHRLDGGGGIGPNLTDDYSVHGATAEAIYTTVAEGVLAKGMPAWKPVLGPGRTKEVVAYVLGLQGTAAENGKAPEGDRVASGMP